MQFNVLTLFPDAINAFSKSSILGKAHVNNLINVNAVNIRDFSANKHKKVDDYPYGGGNGMVMTSQPIYDAYKFILDKYQYKPYCVYLTPQGNTFNQETAMRLKTLGQLTLLCGHYEGVDERVIEEIVDEEISVGDFVLTGGELPALILIDSISRLIPGVLGAENGFEDESFYNGTLEYPQYSRPAEFFGKEVPKILLSGHHENIRKWRRKQSLIRTYQKRPDLFFKLDLSKEDIELIKDEIPI
jgi:tRNA (guanine37-N1)-methyltransferase